MKIVYVAGPYRSKYGFIGRLINIIHARKVAKQLWRMGYAVICPHSNSVFFDGIIKDKQFLNGDLEILKRCDAIVLQGKWEHSKGALKEWDLAHYYDIPVFYWDVEQSDLRKWIRT